MCFCKGMVLYVLKKKLVTENLFNIGGSNPKVGARICKPFKEPRNRFPAWRDGTTTLFDIPIPARQATYSRPTDSITWNQFLGSVNVYNLGLYIRLQLSRYFVNKTYMKLALLHFSSHFHTYYQNSKSTREKHLLLEWQRSRLAANFPPFLFY
jgi:hypothetical protein